MTAQLSKSSTQQLVNSFTDLAVAKGAAIMGDRNAEASRLYWRIDALKNELRSRDGDHRRALAALYAHPDPQVRMEAGLATLAIFPEQARLALQLIRDRKEFPYAGEAGLTLLSLDEGRFKPT
jgi:hypothetical protein